MKIIAAMLALVSLNLFAQTQYHGDKSQIAGVEKAVNYYLEGSLVGDPDIIAKAFHPDAKVQGYTKGKHNVFDLKTFLTFFSTDKPGKHTTEIVSVDITESAASVRCEWHYDTWKYVDYLSLVRFEDGWKVVNKIYTIVQK